MKLKLIVFITFISIVRVIAQPINPIQLVFETPDQLTALFQSTPPNFIQFTAENCKPEELKLTQTTNISAIEIKPNAANSSVTITFKIPSSIDQLRFFLNSNNVLYITVGGKKIYTKYLITLQQAQSDYANFKRIDYSEKELQRDKTNIEYYEYQMYYFESKIVYMEANEFLKNLLEGTITRYEDMLENARQEHTNFLTKTK